MLTLKILFLFIAIWFSIINSGKLMLRVAEGDDIELPTVNLLIHAIGITGFVVLQWLI